MLRILLTLSILLTSTSFAQEFRAQKLSLKFRKASQEFDTNELLDDLFFHKRRCPTKEEKLLRLTKNFTLEEFTASDTAKRLKLENTPNKSQVELIRLFASEVLQPLRDALGPIRISSGYRSTELNEHVGGARQSAHLIEGGFIAADIQGPDLMTIVKKIAELELPVSQVILEPSWVHISSHQVLLRGPSYLYAERAPSGRMLYSCLEWE